MEKRSSEILAAARTEMADRPPGTFVRCRDVLRRALMTADELTPTRQQSLEDERFGYDPVVLEWYEALVRLVHDSVLEGQGNFGSADGRHPPAHPSFTDCRLKR